MSSCPVCEAQNPPNAMECVNCGKAFLVAAVGDAPAGTLDDLELGRLDSSAIPVVEDAMPDLDLARAAPVEVATDVTPDMDLGRSAVVPNVIADATPDMEQTAVAAKEWTPDEEGPVLCRACGVPQTAAGEVFCANCGRHLPVRAAMQGEIITAEAPVGETEADRIRCFSCGAKVFPRPLCSDCGMPLRPLDR